MKKSKPIVFLEGKRIYLRPIEAADLERCQRWMNDPEIRRFILRQTPLDEAEERKWHDNRGRGPYPTDVTLALALKSGDRHVGIVGVHQISWIDRRAVTGAVIGEKDAQDKGYGSEAKALVLEYCFDTLGLHRIASSVLATNPRSLAYLKKNGYREEGRMREHIFRHGKWEDEIMLAILDHEWRAARQTS